MKLPEKSNQQLSNLSFTFHFGKEFSNFDCHSIEFNDYESYLLLVGNHQIKLINFETFITSNNTIIDDDNSILVPCSSEIETVPLFDISNVNRPIVKWNHQEKNQYALAIDRLVRFYYIDHGKIQERHAIIDTQHQRPISTIEYWPDDPNCLLTGSLDGEVQVWDVRHCSSKGPASLKFSLSTPLSIRHIEWPFLKSDKVNPTNDTKQLAIQCDRCVRIYDMRRTDTYLSSIEHSQRILSIDWIMPNRSIVTLSSDNSLRIFSINGNLLAESLRNEQLPFTLNKIRTTNFDNLFICSSRDTISSTYGFTGWRLDEDQHIRPLTDRIVSTSSSLIQDFTYVTHSRFFNLFHHTYSTRVNDDLTKHFPILTWCRDEKLRLIDMDSTFRQIAYDYPRTKVRNLSNSSNLTIISKVSLSSSSSSNFSRQSLNRSNTNKNTMDIIEDETTDPCESDLDDNHYSDLSSSFINNSITSSETGDDNDISISSDHTYNPTNEVSIQNEFNSLYDTYGPYIIVEIKDEQRRICILRCLYPSDGSGSFRIYLIFSRHYPIISQLFVRFKFSSINNTEHLKLFQTHIQTIIDETSYKCFYYGQLCLHKCLIKLKTLFNSYYKQDRISSSINHHHHNYHQNNKNKLNEKQTDESINNTDLDSSNEIFQNTNKNIQRNFDLSFSSTTTRTNDNQVSHCPTIRTNPRTCAARFSGGTYLICFGRITNLQQEPSSAPPILKTNHDGLFHRPPPLHIRSISLTVTKSRGNSSTDDLSLSYRSSTTIKNTVQIQNVSNNQRTTIFSAPVRSSFGSSIIVDHQRISTSSTSFHHSHNHHGSLNNNSTISIYDLSILLPISKKLANDYRIDLKNLIKMCEINQQLTEKMGKYELAYCWHLLANLLRLQTSLVSNDHPWFQTPIAQGLIKHIVSHYISDGDNQSASMFLLTMLKTPYMNKNFMNQHHYDPILYSYANILHRWKYFYHRTQILQEIDYNCQLPAPINSSSLTTTIICSICLQPVVGQHVLCALCAHGGHLNHIHRWFSSTENRHRYCPEKDCTCRCIIKQQELLTVNTDHIQKHQHTPTLTPRTYIVRPSSATIRPL